MAVIPVNTPADPYWWPAGCLCYYWTSPDPTKLVQEISRNHWLIFLLRETGFLVGVPRQKNPYSLTLPGELSYDYFNNC
jgi:hypothetical protein